MNRKYRIRIKDGLNRWFVKDVMGVITYDKFSFTYFTEEEALSIIDKLSSFFDEVELA